MLQTHSQIVSVHCALTTLLSDGDVTTDFLSSCSSRRVSRSNVFAATALWHNFTDLSEILPFPSLYRIEDEWVPEKDVKRIKRVEIAELPVQTKIRLYEQFCASYRKTPSPPPATKPKEAQAAPARRLPARHCTSSRLLNNLLAKQRKERSDCSATNQPMIYGEEEKEKVAEVSGAKKRKMGRSYGGNAFWPCGR